MKIVVIVSGGVVQEIRGDTKDIEISVLDFDDLDEEEINPNMQQALYEDTIKTHKHTIY